ncbi:MAG TPA: VTT domain-containing protein [Bryobacteraceae bacterium]|nr:VTT domain-containing protein [Bryobacteraceae bacterium]
MPFGNDLLIVGLTARRPALFWYYALMATAGSLIGVTLTDYVSRKLSEEGIERMVNPKRLETLRRRLKKHTWWALGLAALLPPPFPFTAFVIAAAAIQIARWRILTAIAAGRAVRFLALSLLAAKYGRQVLRIADRPEVEYFVLGLAAVSVIGSVLSAMKWVRSARRAHAAA